MRGVAVWTDSRRHASISVPQAGLDVAAGAYARLGIAVSDAFIACWACKFHYHLERPITYIRRVIDPG